MKYFSMLYRFYDKYNGADFLGFYNFYKKAVSDFGEIIPEIVLDVGCGTGELSKKLSKDYQVIGVDLSPEMLSVASSKCKGKVLLLNQDMRDLELYGTIQGCVSFCDCFNYMESIEDLEKSISKISLFTEGGGLFVFDASTKHRFENILDKNAFVNEDEDGVLIHRGNYSKKNKCLTMNVTVFEKSEKKDLYKKHEEQQKEYYYSDKQFIDIAERNGFELCGVFGDLKFSKATETDEKHYYVFRRKKWEL